MADSAKFQVPPIENEPVYKYEPGTAERAELKQALKEEKEASPELPMYINGEWIKTDNTQAVHPPHDLDKTIGHYHQGDASHVKQAIQAALDAQEEWAATPWQERAAIFLKAADLIAGPYRAQVNARTMLRQSKNVHQTEIDAVCELIDFLRFNVRFMSEIYQEQPNSAPGMWNGVEYRPLEGFVMAIPPFNFTSIATNLAAAPALMGNTVVWKPSHQTNYVTNLMMEILIEAGLPKGVINLVYTDGKTAGDIALNHPDLAGVHFTGSAPTFQHIWKTVGNNIQKYHNYPRVVGEAGGKDFVVAHKTADPQAVVTALSRASFEYQGQKCSASSRAYLPANLWEDIKEGLLKDIDSFKIGPPEDFTNFINAVIDKKAFDKITGYIDQAKEDDVEIIAGGNYDDSEGYFIDPTVIVTEDPNYLTMREEIFGPVLTIYVYDEEKFEETLDLVDNTSPYGLTGSIFARDRSAIQLAMDKLKYAAGNFYINDKPTAAVVNQQPFGGARASGTNDKAGSKLNLYRWVSARAIKETFISPRDYRYPFMKDK